MTFDKYGASPLSSDHGYQTIWDIVDITELKLRTEAELESFLKATKWRSFGFFRTTRPSYRDSRVHSNVYLVALFPVEFFSDRSIRVVSVDRRCPSNKSLPNSDIREYPSSTQVFFSISLYFYGTMYIVYNY
jgi:hypothetical protein